MSEARPRPDPPACLPESVRSWAFGQWEAPQSRAASDTGTEVMPKLSGAQAVLLATAASRSDLSVLPPPETLTLKGAALERTLSALIRRGLIAEAAVERRARKSNWVVEEDDTRKRQRLVITAAGLDAIGVERGGDAASVTATQPGTPPVTPAGVLRRDRAASSRCCSTRSRVPIRANKVD